jgi:hypothetical protein
MNWFRKSETVRTAALLANISGTSLATVEVAGKFGRDLSAQGEQVMVAFAIEWLADLYGADVKKAVKRTHATRWNAEPLVGGAFSAASPGGQGARKILMEPLRDRIWFAGEAMHETLWGTVGGAWESGVRAAEGALRKMGALKEPEEPRAKQSPKQQVKPAPRRPECAPKALIAWSSGKDSAWALHEIRRRDDYNIVGALTTITDTFSRVSMHGVRQELLTAHCSRRLAGKPRVHSLSVSQRSIRGTHGGGAGQCQGPA